MASDDDDDDDSSVDILRNITEHEPSILLTCYNHDLLQFCSVVQSCPTLCDPMDYSTPGFPVHHQLPEITKTHIHRVCDAIQPSHSLSSPFPPALPSSPPILPLYVIKECQAGLPVYIATSP